MKNFNKLFLAICMMTVPLACGAQGNIQQAENEIKQVINGETEAFQNNNPEKARQFFSNSSKVAFIQRLPDGKVTTTVGGINIDGEPQSGGKVDYLALGFKLLGRSDWNISVRKNIAWVNFRQKTALGDAEYLSDEIRVLEKEKGQWKITLSSTIVH